MNNKAKSAEQEIKIYLESLGFKPDSFSKDELKGGKTPDFRVFKDDSQVFYCEVKMIAKDQWLNNQLQNSKPGEIVGGSRNDPIFNRISDDIHQAYKQFQSVNAGWHVPNVLAFVNHDNSCSKNDLIEVLTGNFYASDGTVHPTMKRVSEGRIKEEKRFISLYIWMQNGKSSCHVDNSRVGHSNRIMELFKINPNDVKRL